LISDHRTYAEFTAIHDDLLLNLAHVVFPKREADDEVRVVFAVPRNPLDGEGDESGCGLASRLVEGDEARVIMDEVYLDGEGVE